MLLIRIPFGRTFQSRFFSRSCSCRERSTTIVPLRKRKSAKMWNAMRGNKENSETHFVDWKRVRVIGGNGGDGAISTLSVHAVEFAGPDGGNGGNGGHVIFMASDHVYGLDKVPSLVQGNHGVPGGKKDCDGKNASHRFCPVPAGTIFRNLEREIVAEVINEGDMFLAARGGAGGRGNASFKSSVNQTPMLAEEGGKGETFIFDVELRSMAHVGLIGFPNAGKSTLLRNISRARPKVAPYPFTTLKPSIGMIQFDDYSQLAVADLPGIIRDAHKNEGLGIDFLRHIERCLCLMYVIDLSDNDPIEHFEILKYELEQYQPGLSRRPHGILANKVDSELSHSNMESFQKYADEQNERIFFISGKVGINLRNVLIYMRQLCEDNILKLRESEDFPK